MSGLFSGYRRLDETEAVPVSTRVPAGSSSAPNSGQAAQLQLTAANGLTQELKRLLEERTRQWHTESARAQRVFGVLIEMAGELCMAEFDAELKNRNSVLLLGSPDKIKGFLVAEIKRKLDAAALANNADLPVAYQTLQAEYSQLQSEHSRLTVDAGQAKQEVIALRRQIAEAEAALAKAQREAASQPAAPTERPAATVSTLVEQAPAVPTDPVAREAKADNGRVDELVRLIAATGLARLNKIREKLATVWGVEAKGGSVRNVVNAAREAGFIKLFEARADWQGAAKPIFVELTDTGARRAQALGVEAARSEIADGIQRGLTLEQLNLILRAADILKEEGHQSVRVFPGRVMLPEEQVFQPTLSAVGPDGNQIYVECEREKADQPRDKRWRLAALAGNGRLWLMTTTPAVQEALVSEVNLSRLNSSFALAAANVVDYTGNRRGKGGGLWTYLS